MGTWQPSEPGRASAFHLPFGGPCPVRPGKQKRHSYRGFGILGLHDPLGLLSDFRLADRRPARPRGLWRDHGAFSGADRLPNYRRDGIDLSLSAMQGHDPEGRAVVPTLSKCFGMRRSRDSTAVHPPFSHRWRGLVELRAY